jgi:uncharacterized protein YciI
MNDDVASIDAGHAGLQKLYYACRTRPVVSLAELDGALEEHKEFLKSLERSGKLLLAGPLLDGESRYDGNGLIIFAARSIAEAKELASSDPFHSRGLREYTLVPWQVNEGSLEVRLNYSEGTFELH